MAQGSPRNLSYDRLELNRAWLGRHPGETDKSATGAATDPRAKVGAVGPEIAAFPEPYGQKIYRTGQKVGCE